eukprot:3941386-Rhodomonas_salina.1
MRVPWRRRRGVRRVPSRARRDARVPRRVRWRRRVAVCLRGRRWGNVQRTPQRTLSVLRVITWLPGDGVGRWHREIPPGDSIGR